MDQQTRVISARWIVPVSSPPINGGSIRLRGDEVVEIQRGRPPQNAQDFGDMAILPGLVNAHTHLEFSDCDQPIGHPGMELHQWIQQVVRARREMVVNSKSQTIEAGILESRESGVCLIGEISTPPFQYAEDAMPRIVAFAEVLGLSPERLQERFASANSHNREHVHAGWSPHAPYSIPLDAIQECVTQATASSRPVAMHVAESIFERELLASGSGPFADQLREMGVWRDGVFPWPDDPILLLIECLSKAPRGLIVHGNDLHAAEVDAIAKHSQLSIVYCPRTHAYFRHAPHPVAQLVERGVRVALGTDSRASNPDLNLWREVQYVLRHRPDLNPEIVIRMATLNGADALGHGDLGRIEAGSRGPLGCVHTEAADLEQLYADLAEGDFCPLAGSP